jgi:hypothetical protein
MEDWGCNVRVVQSRSAIPSTSTSQHCGVPEEQTVVCLSWKIAGVAKVLARRLVTTKSEVNEVLMIVIERSWSIVP